MKKIFALLLSFVAVGCSLTAPEPYVFDLSELPVEQGIEGQITPFTVPTDTRITHRLANDGRLVAYLMSSNLDLDVFQEYDISLTGVWQSDEMRRVLEVKNINVTDPRAPKIVAAPDWDQWAVYATKSYGFAYPANWAYSQSAGGELQFIQADDPSSKVLLRITPEPNGTLEAITSEYAGLRAYEMTKGNRKTITLESRDYPATYTFAFNDDGMGIWNQVQRMLRTFTEGEQNVRTMVNNQLATGADSVQTQMETFLVEIAVDEPEEEPAGTDEGKTELEVKDDDEDETSKENEQVEQAAEEPVKAATEFTNKITASAHRYDGREGYVAYFPAQSWYRSFGGRTEFNFNRIGVNVSATPESFDGSQIQLAYNDNASGECEKADETTEWGGDIEVKRYFAKSCTMLVVSGKSALRNEIFSIAAAFVPIPGTRRSETNPVKNNINVGDFNFQTLENFIVTDFGKGVDEIGMQVRKFGLNLKATSSTFEKSDIRLLTDRVTMIGEGRDSIKKNGCSEEVQDGDVSEGRALYWAAKYFKDCTNVAVYTEIKNKKLAQEIIETISKK